MAKEIKLPQISEGVDSAEVAEVMVAAGDSISEGDSMIAVETDKASVEVPCTASGKIKEVKVKEGETITVGDVILVLEEADSGSEEPEEDATADEKDEQPAEEESGTGKKAAVAEKDEQENDEGSDEKAESKDEGEPDGEDEEREATDTDGGGQEATEEEEPPADEKQDDEKAPTAVAAAPSARRLARELGVDIRSVKGSGAQGRISEADVKSVKENGAGVEASAGEKLATAQDLPDFSKWGNIETQKLSRIRKAIAQSTSKSWSQIPHVTQFDQADVTDLENYRKKMQEKAGDLKITVTAILAKIAVSALQRFPTFNASLDLANQEIILKHYYHIGLAVDTEKGLLMPVIKDADKKSIYDIAAEITELSEKARNQKLAPEEMQGGTFVVSNLGGIGGTNFTPIIYHPQVAILGVSRTSIQPVYIEDAFQPRQILPLSLSYDHRVIDGAAGAKFLRWICNAIEDPLKAMLES